MTVQKQYLLTVQNKRKYLTRDILLYPRVTTHKPKSAPAIALHCFENARQAENYAIEKGYIVKDKNGGFKFTIIGIQLFI